jgi:ribosomal protein S18 acetylase RimI-like enzyme
LVRLPEPDVLSSWLTTLSSWGYNSVRTSALGPVAASSLTAIGFTVAQDLSLLERPATSHPIFSLPTTPSLAKVRMAPFSRTLKNSVVAELLAVDRAAFGSEWTLDEETLREALNATKRVRLFVWRSQGRIAGFVLAGATGKQGFIQRLAVHPDAQKMGVATQLLEASLSWTHQRGCTSTVVNTEISNAAALRTYHRFGFASMDYGLSVLEMQITP